MKPVCLLLLLSVVSGAVCAEQTDSCAGLEGSALNQCRSNQQTLRLQQLEQQLQQQQERQNQLDRQQRETQQQFESLRQQNDSLRKQMEREATNQPARPQTAGAVDPSRNQDLRSWKAENPWFGADYARTQFAMRYIKELQQERPELAGRELLDAVSAKTNEAFGNRP